MEKKKVEHNFGEQEIEKVYEKGEIIELDVWKSPKYMESREKAIEMIDSNKYDLKDGDFWILKNKTKTGKMAYTGLIISHNGCLKINDNVYNKVKPSCFSLDKDGYNNSLVYTYIDDDTYEVGEFSPTNGKNDYPYAMAFKRCFDRVVLKKSKLAYAGIYSEVEAEEFKAEQKEDMHKQYDMLDEIMKLEVELEIDHDYILGKYNVKTNDDLSKEQIKEILQTLKIKKELKGKEKNDKQ